jgi:cytidylate kinase
MNTRLHDHLGGYFLSHSKAYREHETPHGMAVTISREAGAGGNSVARELIRYLDEHMPRPDVAWKVFDHNLVEEAVNRHQLRPEVAQYMAEDAASFVRDTVEDLLGLHPSAPEMVRRVSETMLSLARNGHVILIGRGGNLVTARLRNAVHVRLVAPLEARVRHMAALRGISEAEAEDFVAATDRSRRRYVRQNFGGDVEDAVTYDMVLNTGTLGFAGAAELIGRVVQARAPVVAPAR